MDSMPHVARDWPQDHASAAEFGVLFSTYASNTFSPAGPESDTNSCVARPGCQGLISNKQSAIRTLLQLRIALSMKADGESVNCRG